MPVADDAAEGADAVPGVEEALRDTEQRFNELLDSLWDGVLDLSADLTRVQYLNGAAADILGRPLPELYQQKSLLTAYTHPDDATVARHAVEELQRHGHLDRSWRITRRQGEVRWVHVRARATLRPDGTPLHVEALIRDVTHAREQEDALRRSEASFRAMIEGSPDAVMVTRAGHLAFVNPATLRLLGLSDVKELVGQPFVDLLHPEDRAGFQAAGVRQANVTWRMPRRDGNVATVEVSSLAVEFQGEPSVLLVARDQTEKQKLQAGLMLSDRMASMGMLVAGVAHEINNPLAFLLPNIHLALAELGRLVNGGTLQPAEVTAISDVREALTDALDGAQRVKKTVADLKLFSRVADDARSPIDVQAVLESSLNIAWSEIRHRARLQKDYVPVPRVMGQEAHLGQVFINLIVNATQAIVPGAVDRNRITVRTRVSPDGMVVAEISDSGEGISPENLSRLFDPFFTTKPVGVGTGLGLSICHRIVTGMGGSISAESEAGKGSTFRVTLPPASVVTVRPAGPAAPEAAVQRRRGRVVVVDDEALVAATVKRCLAMDHDVEVITDPAAALEKLTASPSDAVVCDVMMPSMSGMEFHRRLKAINPQLADRVVFVTGGMLNPGVREFMESVPNPRLEKPFDLGQLRATLGRVIAGI